MHILNACLYIRNEWKAMNTTVSLAPGLFAPCLVYVEGQGTLVPIPGTR